MFRRTWRRMMFRSSDEVWPDTIVTPLLWLPASGSAASASSAPYPAPPYASPPYAEPLVVLAVVVAVVVGSLAGFEDEDQQPTSATSHSLRMAYGARPT